MGPFQAFVKALGPGRSRQPPDADRLADYEGRLPAALTAFTNTEGFCAYGNGLLWIVHPVTLEDVLADWLDDPEDAVPFARTAFGDLFVWRPTGVHLIDVQRHTVTKVVSDIHVFFDKYALDETIHKKILRKPVFDRALARLGPLPADEVYTFVPPLAPGVEPDGDKTAKARLRDNLAFLASRLD